VDQTSDLSNRNNTQYVHTQQLVKWLQLVWVNTRSSVPWGQWRWCPLVFTKGQEVHWLAPVKRIKHKKNMRGYLSTGTELHTILGTLMQRVCVCVNVSNIMALWPAINTFQKTCSQILIKI
jgi:type IV secretory pathway protease TraF